MDILNKDTKKVTLEELAAITNNVNLGKEVIVFEGYSTSHKNESVHFPIRIDAMAIILCSKGTGQITIDLKEYEITENSIMIIQPNNYITNISGSSDSLAQVMMISRKIAEDILPKITDMLPLMLNLNRDSVIKLNQTEFDIFSNLYKYIKTALSRGNSKLLKQKIICILQTILFEIVEIKSNKRTDNDPFQHSRKEEIMAKFIMHVGQNFKTHRQVAFYSNLMCITSKHLSAVIKEISNRTPSDWIDNFVILETKVLLKSTNMSIQEIANTLNFSNQSFFGKYFKHNTGLTPSEYRKANQ